MSRPWFRFIAAALLIPSTNLAAEAAIQKIGDDLYAGVGNNAVLLILATQLAQALWILGKWVVDKYFSDQKQEKQEDKQFKEEVREFNAEVAAALRELRAEVKGLGRLPSENEIMGRLEHRLEFMVFKAARDLGITKDKK